MDFESNFLALAKNGDYYMSVNEDIKVYQDKKTKAEDFKSSAYTLFIVGFLGIIALILIECGLLPVQLAAPNKYITYFVMGAMFLVFMVMGVSSFRSFKVYEKEAVTEDKLTADIKKWTKENIDVKELMEKVRFEEDILEEEKYFRYFEILKSCITDKFGKLNASYLEAVCEEVYTELFENE